MTIISKRNDAMYRVVCWFASMSPGARLMSKTIYRGSAKHRILAELERYPDTLPEGLTHAG